MSRSKQILWTAIFGIVSLALLAYPLLIGAAAYYILGYFGVHARDHIAIVIAWFSILLIPFYILGDALWKSSKGHTDWKTDALSHDHLTKPELIEIWKTSQDVQMHFNNIELQIRNYAVTLLVAVIGAAAYALKEHLDVDLAGRSFSMAIAILPAGVLGWIAFYFMDKHWYHRLLLGAVQHTLKLEKTIGPTAELSTAVGSLSAIPLTRKINIHSTQKIDIFYAAVLTFFVILSGLVLVAAKPSTEKSNGVSPPQLQLTSPAISRRPGNAKDDASPKDLGTESDNSKQSQAPGIK